MTRLGATFVSLRTLNFRLFIGGQVVSVCGTWMQKLGQAWLVLELTGSGTLLGVTAALQHLPTLVAGPWGGVLADRLDKRRVLLRTQTVSGVLALLLAGLTGAGVVAVWMVMVLAFALGMTQAVDRPARQTFVVEMVGHEHLTNAITLNNVVMKTGMLVGPALAGVLISWVGIASSFALNGLSFGAVVIALLLMRTAQLQRAVPVPRAHGQIRAGFTYVRRTPVLLGPLGLMAVFGMFAAEWTVTLPLLATDAFAGDASTLGTMYSAMGLGAVLGGLVIASSVRSMPPVLIATGFGFAVAVLLVALAPTLPLALAGLVLVGGATIAVQSVASSLLQLLAAPAMRGRVISLLTMAMLGTKPIGAPLIGWVGDTFGSRIAVAIGAIGVASATTALLIYLRRHDTLAAANIDHIAADADHTPDRPLRTVPEPGDGSVPAVTPEPGDGSVPAVAPEPGNGSVPTPHGDGRDARAPAARPRGR